LIAISFEEAGTHKSANTHAGTVSVTRETDLLTPKWTGFEDSSWYIIL